MASRRILSLQLKGATFSLSSQGQLQQKFQRAKKVRLKEKYSSPVLAHLQVSLQEL